MTLDKDSRAAKLMLPTLLAACSMLGPFSIDTAFPAFEVMGRDFVADTNSMQWVVSAYLFSFGVMSIFHGPLSDALGRKPVMIGGIGVSGGSEQEDEACARAGLEVLGLSE